MNFRQRHPKRAANPLCVLLLCMVSIMLLGFSNPQEHYDADLLASLEIPEADTVIPSMPSQQEKTIQQPEKTTRPHSLAGNTRLQPTLGGVDSRTWLRPLADSRKPDYLASVLGQFDGVGFPEIRTYPRARRSPFAPPGPWAPLVEWRTMPGEQIVVEPIAKVRCMGLTPKAVARRADRYRDLIYAYAEQYDISAQLIKAVITEESCFNNKALSSVGAQGLMQLMPDTATWLKVKDPHDPADNLRGGVRYLASLQKEFDTLELALAAYNAGPGNVRRYNGVPPFAETKAYVVKVQANYRRYKAAHRLLNPIDEGEADTLDLKSELMIEGALVEFIGP